MKRHYLPLAILLAGCFVFLRLKAQDTKAQDSYQLHAMAEKNYEAVPAPGFQNLHKPFVASASAGIVSSSSRPRFTGSPVVPKQVSSSLEWAEKNAELIPSKDSCFDSSFTRLISIRNNYVFF